jgi:aspartate-semialdehyde dehydrogenase
MTHIAIVGASEEVATDLIEVLAERGFDLAGLRVLADESLAGEAIEAAGFDVRVEPAVSGSLQGCAVALFVGDGTLARELVPEAQARGVLVIDATPYSREELHAPVILPEVNADRLAELVTDRVIALPSPHGVGLAVALAPLHDAATVRRVVTTVFESAAVRGREAMDRLSAQSVKLMQGRGLERGEAREQLAFNVRPQAAHLDVDGWAVDERRIAADLTALFAAPAPDVVATVVRVPVFAGVAQSVYVELERPLGLDEAQQLLREGRGILVAEPPADDEDQPDDGDDDARADERDDEPYDDEYADDAGDEQEPTYDVLHDASPGPVDVSGSDAVHVARLHTDLREPRALAFWIAFDELRKGTSLTMVATLEIALRELA